MKLPHNVWYAIIPMPGANLFDRPEDAIPVDFSSVTELSDDAERAYSAPMVLTVKRLAELATRAKITHYIPEEYWKKIDQVEEYIAKRVSGYFLDNRSVRRIESYAAVYLAAGGKLSDALDCVVAGKLLHRLSGCPKEEISGEEHGAAALLDKVFGLDNMPKSIECARRLGASEENASEAVADESDEGLTGTENEILEETDNGQSEINEMPEVADDATDDAEAETSADAGIDSINEESSEPEENVDDDTEETVEESAQEISVEPATEAAEEATENGPVNTDLIF